MSPPAASGRERESNLARLLGSGNYPVLLKLTLKSLLTLDQVPLELLSWPYSIPYEKPHSVVLPPRHRISLTFNTPQVDTIAKRLMSNQSKIAGVSELNSVIFKEKANATTSRKFFSLFPGLGYAAGYKVRRVVFEAPSAKHS